MVIIYAATVQSAWVWLIIVQVLMVSMTLQVQLTIVMVECLLLKAVAGRTRVVGKALAGLCCGLLVSPSLDRGRTMRVTALAGLWWCCLAPTLGCVCTGRVSAVPGLCTPPEHQIQLNITKTLHATTTNVLFAVLC